MPGKTKHTASDPLEEVLGSNPSETGLRVLEIESRAIQIERPRKTTKAPIAPPSVGVPQASPPKGL